MLALLVCIEEVVEVVWLEDCYYIWVIPPLWLTAMEELLEVVVVEEEELAATILF